MLKSCRTFDQPILAIYIRTFQRQAQFYTMDGRWVHRVPRKVYFSMPGFASRSEVAPILPYLPQTEVPDEELDQFQILDLKVPRSVAVQLVDRMVMFFQASDKAYRTHADKIDNAYELLADEKHMVYATLSEIASKVLEEPDESKISKSTLWAVHRALISREMGFAVDHRDHRSSGHFEILARREVKTNLQVRKWLREYQEDVVTRAASSKSSGKKTTGSELHGSSVILDFVERAREIITESRKYRAVTQTGSIGPCSVQPGPQRQYWTENEIVGRNVTMGPFTSRQLVIIRFMEYWAARRSIKATSTLASMGPMILRAVGMYDGFLLNEITGYTFLQEMGVLTPWENRVAFDSRLALPGLHFDLVTDNLQAKAAETLDKWQPQDSMKHLRKDWKDLEVFCIDQSDAGEIDDGFSIQKIQGDKKHYWVHIHIANPTAFISPDHPISQYAAQLTETLYFPERLYCMLSPIITQRYLSLNKDRPALTFSAKMSVEGDIVDYEIVPSIVRNVRYLTPETISKALSPKKAVFRPWRSFQVGVFPPPDSSDRRRLALNKTLTKSQKAALRTIQMIGAARRRKRELLGAINITLEIPNVSVQRTENSQPYRTIVRRVEGDPAISIKAKEFEPMRSKETLESEAADLMVPDIMILACEVGALWCKQRGIPMIYRGTQLNPELPSPAAYKEQILDPAAKKFGSPPFLVMLNYIKLVGRSLSSVDPVHHVIIGTDAYTKISSPLRRYGDMVGHWQIEAAIRREAETGKSLTGNTDNSYLPFSREKLEAIIPRISARERMIASSKRTSSRHWVLQLLQRAFFFKECELPETFRLYVYSAEDLRTGTMLARSKELGIEVRLARSPITQAQGGMQLGDWWECKMAGLDIFARIVNMDAVRLIERQGQQV